MRAMKSILRKPDSEEAELIARLGLLSEEAAGYCKAKAADLNIRLKLVEVYGAMDRRQLTFVYTADERIDFRELVRDLARRFGGRIEMRQVGVREEARRLGGIDTCGLILCCASFLTDVKPVTAKQAKKMDLPVDDPRLLGVCGRLKCCLMFEMMDAEERFRLKRNNSSLRPKPTPLLLRFCHHSDTLPISRFGQLFFSDFAESFRQLYPLIRYQMSRSFSV